MQYLQSYWYVVGNPPACLFGFLPSNQLELLYKKGSLKIFRKKFKCMTNSWSKLRLKNQQLWEYMNYNQHQIRG
jgi:hypothetical protein